MCGVQRHDDELRQAQLVHDVDPPAGHAVEAGVALRHDDGVLPLLGRWPPHLCAATEVDSPHWLSSDVGLRRNTKTDATSLSNLSKNFLVGRSLPRRKKMAIFPTCSPSEKTHVKYMVFQIV